MNRLQKTTNLMRDAFKAAKEEIDQRKLPIPESEYIARIQYCALTKSKSSDNKYIALAYYICEGEEKGRVEYDNSLVLIPEKTRWILQFFERFELDTNPILEDDYERVIKEYCEMIFKAAPIVQIRTKHWHPQDNENETRVNYFLNKIIEGWGDEEVSVSDQHEDDENSDEDEFTSMSKQELKDYALEKELDISMKSIAKASEDELRELIREQVQTDSNESEDSSSDETEDLRKRLLQLCESQGIEEVNKSMGIDEIKEVIGINPDDAGYQFETEGENALTNEEIETLIDADLDYRILDSEPETNPPPQKKKAVPKKKSTKKTTKSSFPARKKGGRK